MDDACVRYRPILLPSETRVRPRADHPVPYLLRVQRLHELAGTPGVPPHTVPYGIREHLMDTASTTVSSIQYRGLRETAASAAHAPRQARQDTDGGVCWRWPGSGTPDIRRACSLSSLHPRVEDLPRLPLLYSHGHHDIAWLLTVFHYDHSRFHVPMIGAGSTTH